MDKAIISIQATEMTETDANKVGWSDREVTDGCGGHIILLLICALGLFNDIRLLYAYIT